MGKIFTVGDIHGAHKALLQCLERSNFNYEEDTLIVLGDVVDSWSESPECVDELLKIKNLIPLLGNHDQWFMEAIEINNEYWNDTWLSQGGEATREAYKRVGYDKKMDHYSNYFKKCKMFHIDEQNRCFVHAGYTNEEGCDKSGVVDLWGGIDWIWDRTLFAKALSGTTAQQPKILKPHKEIYIGHTPTINLKDHYKGQDTSKPINICNLWAIDTGAGYGYRLSIMDIDSKEIWQSDLVSELYPNEKGR